MTNLFFELVINMQLGELAVFQKQNESFSFFLDNFIRHWVQILIKDELIIEKNFYSDDAIVVKWYILVF